MSKLSDSTAGNPVRSDGSNQALEQDQPTQAATPENYKGFVAGVFSGVAKLSVGHPFDTIKVRLQTTPKSQFKGPVDCLLQTVRKEGVRGLYKGATPPLVGWMLMDSIMLGSLTFYRRILLENIFSKTSLPALPNGAIKEAEKDTQKVEHRLPALGHGIAGIMAGATVSFVAAPIEHIKARLQIQYAVEKSKRLYSGPIDCCSKIYRIHGLRGIFRGLSATLLLHDILTRFFSTHTTLSTPAINFWAGGLSAQVFWLTSYPSDVVKQRIMTDGLGKGHKGKELGDGEKRFPRWKDAAMEIWKKDGPRGYWRGFAPCFLRAFPANAVALVAFEGVMRSL